MALMCIDFVYGSLPITTRNKNNPKCLHVISMFCLKGGDFNWVSQTLNISF